MAHRQNLERYFHKTASKRGSYLDGLVRFHYDGNEEAEHDVDKQTNEAVEVDATVPPDVAVLIDRCKCDEQLVTVDQSKQTLGCCAQRTELCTRTQHLQITRKRGANLLLQLSAEFVYNEL